MKSLFGLLGLDAVISAAAQPTTEIPVKTKKLLIFALLTVTLTLSAFGALALAAEDPNDGVLETIHELHDHVYWHLHDLHHELHDHFAEFFGHDHQDSDDAEADPEAESETPEG